MQVPQGPETLHLPGAEVIGGVRHLGPELGPLQEQYMIITSEHLCNLSAVCLLRQTLS